jgi:hypothetical protein
LKTLFPAVVRHGADFEMSRESRLFILHEGFSPSGLSKPDNPP